VRDPEHPDERLAALRGAVGERVHGAGPQARLVEAGHLDWVGEHLGGPDQVPGFVLVASGKPVIVAAVRDPYDIAHLPSAETYVATYSYAGVSLRALGKTLFGEVNPSGRLPVDIPAAGDPGMILYPFGHGLGYTTWSYDGLVVDGRVARVTVRNTGARAGKEVVQAYLSRPDSVVERPVRWLVGFAVVSADPGETVTVDVPLDRRAFAYWSVEDGAWVDEPGEFTLAVGRSVQDTALSAPVSCP
jgi:hypothetical protein